MTPLTSTTDTPKLTCTHVLCFCKTHMHPCAVFPHTLQLSMLVKCCVQDFPHTLQLSMLATHKHTQHFASTTWQPKRTACPSTFPRKRNQRNHTHLHPMAAHLRTADARKSAALAAELVAMHLEHGLSLSLSLSSGCTDASTHSTVSTASRPVSCKCWEGACLVLRKPLHMLRAASGLPNIRHHAMMALAAPPGPHKGNSDANTTASIAGRLLWGSADVQTVPTCLRNNQAANQSTMADDCCRRPLDCISKVRADTHTVLTGTLAQQLAAM